MWIRNPLREAFNAWYDAVYFPTAMGVEAGVSIAPVPHTCAVTAMAFLLDDEDQGETVVTDPTDTHAA